MAGDDIQIGIAVESSDAEKAFEDLAKRTQKLEQDLHKTKKRNDELEDGLKKTGDKGKGAFDGISASLHASLAGIVSTTAALGLVHKVLQLINEEKEKAAKFDMSNEMALSKLAGLAKNPQDMKRMVDAASRTFAEGGTATLPEAAEMQFNLESASLGEDDRKFASSMVGIMDMVGTTDSFAKMKEAMGANEVGTLRQFASKTMLASMPVSGASGPHLGLAALEGATSANLLGLSDEELLALTSTVAQKSPSTQKAATRVKGMLQKFVEFGFADTMKGQGLDAMIGAIQSEGLSSEQLKDRFGDAEAMMAFNLADRGQVEANRLGLVGANTRDYTEEARKNRDSVPSIVASMDKRRAEAEKENFLSESGVGTAGNTTDAMIARAQTKNIRDFGMLGGSIANVMDMPDDWMRRTFGGEEVAQREIQRRQAMRNPNNGGQQPQQVDVRVTVDINVPDDVSAAESFQQVSK